MPRTEIQLFQYLVQGSLFSLKWVNNEMKDEWSWMSCAMKYCIVISLQQDILPGTSWFEVMSANHMATQMLHSITEHFIHNCFNCRNNYWVKIYMHSKPMQNATFFFFFTPPHDRSGLLCFAVWMSVHPPICQCSNSTSKPINCFCSNFKSFNFLEALHRPWYGEDWIGIVNVEISVFLL